MNYSPLIGLTILMIAFTSFLFVIGFSMLRVQSIEKDLAAYRKNPEQGTLMQKYFYGYAILDGKITEWTINNIGDKLYSGWIKVSGAIFILFGISFIAGVGAMWYVTLRGL